MLGDNDTDSKQTIHQAKWMLTLPPLQYNFLFVKPVMIRL